MRNKQEGNSSSYNNNIIFQDYWLDFIGGLLPGALFLLVISLMIFPVLMAFYYSIVQPESMDIIHSINILIKLLIKIPNILWFMLISIIFLIIFVVGHIFYRKDPKLPDQVSFKHILKKEAQQSGIVLKNYLENINGTEYKDFVEHLKQNYGCTSTENCEFPYPYLSDYLKERGLFHLNNYVIWKDNIKMRSKNIINILKLRVRFYYPERSTTIVRNEAHVRLASSLWYASKTIRGLALICIFILLLSCAIVYSNGNQLNLWKEYSTYFSQLGAILLILIIFFISFSLAKMHIESFFHYQRRREIIYLLETAWIAFSTDKNGCLPFCEDT